MLIDTDKTWTSTSNPAARLLRSAPVAFLLAGAVPPLFIIGQLLGFEPHELSPFLAFIVCGIPLLMLCGALERVGRIGRSTRWGLAAGLLVPTALVIGAYDYIAPEISLPAPCFAILVAAVLITPTLTATDESAREARTWRRLTRLLIHSPIAFAFVGWLACVAALSAHLSVGHLSETVEVATWLVTFIAGTSFMTAALLSTRCATIDGQLTQFDRWEEVSVHALTWTSLAAVVLLSAAVCIDTASYPLESLHPVDALVRAAGLSIVAIAGTIGLFLTSGTDHGLDLEGVGINIAQKVFRVFPLGFLVLVAWTGPAIYTSFEPDGWLISELFFTVVLGTCAVYCGVRLVFDVLGIHLPVWVMNTIYAVGVLVFGVLTI